MRQSGVSWVRRASREPLIGVFGGSADELSENQIDLVMEEVLDPRFVDYEDIETGPLTHRGGQGAAFAEFIPGSDTAVIWLTGSVMHFLVQRAWSLSRRWASKCAGTDAAPSTQ